MHFQKGTTKSCWHFCCSPYCTAFLFRTINQVVFCSKKKRHPETIPRAVPPSGSTSMGASWKPMTFVATKRAAECDPKNAFPSEQKKMPDCSWIRNLLREQVVWTKYSWKVDGYSCIIDDLVAFLTKIVQDKALKFASNCDGSLYWHQ